MPIMHRTGAAFNTGDLMFLYYWLRSRNQLVRMLISTMMERNFYRQRLLMIEQEMQQPTMADYYKPEAN